MSKAGKEVSVNIPKLFLNTCFYNEEVGMQDAIICDDSEQSGESVSSSEYERVTQGSLKKLLN
jgi:hypothetical protein